MASKWWDKIETVMAKSGPNNLTEVSPVKVSLTEACPTEAKHYVIVKKDGKHLNLRKSDI